MSLTKTTIRGVAWSFIDLLLRRGIAAATTLVLAYFLSPADFGLISMSALFLAVAAGLMDSGLREGLVRRRFLSTRLLNAAMAASIGLGGGGYLLLFISAPWIATFYAEPRLLLVIRIGGLVVFFNALQMAPIARLQQALDFKSLMKAGFPSSIISSLFALALAWAGYGVWALIVQNLVAAVLMTVLLWRLAGWHPSGRAGLGLLLPLYCFGYKLFLSSLIALVVRNAIPSMLGKFLGATTAGYYYFVDKIMEMIMGQLVYSIQNVTYPAFSKIALESQLLLDAYRKFIKVMIFVVSPLMMIGAALAEPLFHAVFPRDWWPAKGCFQWLCVVYTIYPMHALNLNILKVKGRSDLFLFLEVVKATITIIALWCSLPYGLEGVLLGQIIVSLICYIPNAIYSKPLIGYSICSQFMDVLPYFACSTVAGGIAVYFDSALSGQPNWVVLLLGSSFSVVVYLLLCWLLRLEALPMILLVLRRFRGKLA